MANTIEQIINEPKGLLLEVAEEIHNEMADQVEEGTQLDYQDLLSSVELLSQSNVTLNPGIARNHAIMIAAYAARLAQRLDLEND